MTTYAELADEQKKAIAIVTNIMREESGVACKLALRISAEQDSSGTAYVKYLIDQLDANSYIPNESGVRGSCDLTKEQWLALYAMGQAITAIMTPSNRKACIDAAGPLACVG
jgi:hypothetical protein